jgi:hypothetical protein
MKQVTYMKNRIADHPKHARRRLEEDPIKVVAGVGGQLFIIDHHHTAEAWLGAKTEWVANALCKIVNSEKGAATRVQNGRRVLGSLEIGRPCAPQE